MEDNTPQDLPQNFHVPRPPLGLMPRWLYEEKRGELDSPVDMMAFDVMRLYAIKGAVKRYAEADKEVPEAWLHELNDI